MFDRFIFKDVGTNMVPISDFKCGALDFITQPIASLGSGIISAVGSYLGAKETNKSQERIAKENRNWQSDENQKSRDWEEEMWNQTNLYNTPSAQMKRLREAGINPFISGSGGYSNVSQVPSAPGMSGSPSMPVLENPMANASALFNSGVQGAVSSAQIGANVANQNAKTAIDAIKAYDEFLKSSNGDYKGAKALLGTLLKPLGYSSKQMESIMKGANLNYLFHKIETDKKEVEYEIVNQYGKAKAKAEIDNINKLTEKLDSDIIHNKSLDRLNDAQVRELAERTAKEIEEKLTIQQSREFIIRKLQAEVNILEADPMGNGTFAAMFKGVPILGQLLNLIIHYLKK